MNTAEGEQIALLKEIRVLAEEILLLTSQLTLTGEKKDVEQDTEGYALLMEKREPLVLKMAQLKKQAYTITNEADCLTEWQATEGIIKEILALDGKHKTIVQQVMSSVKTSMKGVKNGIKLTSRYKPYAEDIRVGLLDTKK
jgi:hypothetical protein